MVLSCRERALHAHDAIMPARNHSFSYMRELQSEPPYTAARHLLSPLCTWKNSQYHSSHRLLCCVVIYASDEQEAKDVVVPLFTKGSGRRVAAALST